MPALPEQSPDILIVGAGPVGLAAALFLDSHGVGVRLIDKGNNSSTTSRAQIVNPRSLELLEENGVAAKILKESRDVLGVRFYEDWKPVAALDFTDIPSRYKMAAIPQARTEALLAEALALRGIAPERGREFISLKQTGEAVSTLVSSEQSGEETIVSRIVLGTDGAHSPTRAAIGADWVGHGFPESWPLYDIYLDDPLDRDHAHVLFVDDGSYSCYVSSQGFGGSSAMFPICSIIFRQAQTPARLSGNRRFILATSWQRTSWSAVSRSLEMRPISIRRSVREA
ncbi:FAD-dependent monooxygenase [Marinobacter sp. AC-23]|uniref:FAD-dependent monooxygenase n=1 Tax=Marinobacter sp. AC-23 TaxID=1879031 RepID=UPI0008DE2F12|nr:FAD-dependent monooxygenase [Marinobacter sp. AC-23]OHY82800.1 hypothetical protein BCA33_00900 [Marinobacter sp. AC-23]